MGKSFPAPDSGGGGEGTGSRSNPGGRTASIDPEEAWLRSWAFATSPYGLGLTSEQSWALTPRAFHALERVRNEHIKSNLALWAQERADFRNANHFGTGGQARHWTIEDFTDPAGAAKRRQKTQDDGVREIRAKLEASKEAARIQEAKRVGDYTAAEDDLGIPAWARMTPEEKAERNGR